MDGINIEIRAGRDGIFFVPFHPYTLCSKEDAEGEFQWLKIWKLKVPNKVQMFIWRFAHNSLPVRRNVARRGIKHDTVCPVCKRLDEDCGDLFFKCKYARQCWRLMNMEDLRIILQECRVGKDTISRIWSFDKTVHLKV